jgi:tartrate-resistant acid phosphatase type 5
VTHILALSITHRYSHPQGNVSAEVAYSNINPRWNFPSLYHSRSFVSEDGVTVDVILIDTVDLSGSVDYGNDENDPRYFDKLPYRAKSEAADQWAWIEEQLAQSTAQYVLVGGHYSVYSVCKHGDSQNLQDNLKPLLQQYGAHYMSGHDHCMEALEEAGENYIVSGLGDTCCYPAENLPNVPADIPKWYVSKETKTRGTIAGFSSVTAHTDAMTVTFYDQDGATLYTTPEIAPRSAELQKKKTTL